MPRSYLSFRSSSAALAVALVAGNALVRGGVDDLALAVSLAVAVAALALAPGRRSEKLEISAVAIGLAASVLWVAFQLVPLPPGLLLALSPHTAGIFTDALGPLGLPWSWRPISLDPGGTAAELCKAAVFAAAALAAAVLAGSSDRRRDQLLRGIALAGVAVTVVYYAAALLGRSPLVAPRATFVNPNHLAGFLLLSAWPGLGFALRARGAARLAWLLAFAFTASGTFLSLSRAGVTAFFVAAGLFAWMSVRREPPRRRGIPPPPMVDALPLRRRAAHFLRSSRTPVIIGVFAALAISAWLALGRIVHEMSTVSDSSTTALKLGMWPLALQMIREFPLFGIGRGAFATVYPAYKWEPVQRTFTHVENEWLQLPLDLGVLPGIALIGLVAWAWFSAARRRDLSRPLAGALAGAGALVAQNLFDFSLEVPGVAIPFAMVIAIAGRDLPRVRLRPWAIRALAGALLVVAVAGLSVHRAHPTEEDAAAVAAAATADEAVALAAKTLEWHPADYIPPTVVGGKLASERRCREALPWLTRAMARNPTAPEPHRAAGYCLAGTGQLAFAKREYRLAFSYGDQGALAEANVLFPGPGELFEVAPDTPAGLLAAGHLLRDRPAEAAEAFRRAWESFHEPRALAPLASAALAIPDPEDALSVARLLQSDAPRTASGYALAARALDALERPDDAMKELELGATRLPGEADVLAPLGARHLAQRRFSQAKGIFEAIIARDGPRLAHKHVLIARALAGQSRYQEALREVQTARDIAPADAGVLSAFAWAAAAAGRFDEAIETLEVASRLPGATPADYAARISELRERRSEQEQHRAAEGLR